MKTNFEKPNNPSSVEGQAKLDWIKRYNLKRFGTNDQSKINELTAQQYADYEPGTEQLEGVTGFPETPFEEVLEKTEKKSFKKFDHQPKKRVENLKTLPSSRQDRANRGQLRDTMDTAARSYLKNNVFKPK